MRGKLNVPTPRAKIFQAFDALPGLRETLRRQELEHERIPRPELSEEQLNELDDSIRRLEPGQRVMVKSFEDGRYKRYEGAFEKLDVRKGFLMIGGETVLLGDIVEIECMGTEA